MNRHSAATNLSTAINKLVIMTTNNWQAIQTQTMHLNQ